MSLQKFFLLTLLMVSGLKDCVTQEITPNCSETAEKCGFLLKCGKLWYDPKIALCCNETIIKKTSPYDQCCGPKVFNSLKQACCAGVILEKSSSIDQCCGKTLYNPKKELCCNGTINPRLSGGCCGSRSYDLKSSKCCNGVLGSIIGFPTSALCCGSVVYDSLKYKCCRGGAIVPINQDCVSIKP